MSPIVTTDIRGVARPVGSAYDIGVVEGAGGDPVGGIGVGIPTPPTSGPDARFIVWEDSQGGSVVIRFFTTAGVEQFRTGVGSDFGIEGVVLDSGGLVAGQTGSGTPEIVIRSSTFGDAIASFTPSGGDHVRGGIRSNYSDRFYTGVTSAAGTKIVALSVAGTVIATWTVDPGPTTKTGALAVAADNSVAYFCPRLEAVTILRWDLIGDTGLSGFTLPGDVVVNGGIHDNGMMCLRGGDLLVATGNANIRRYNPAGTITQSYVCGIDQCFNLAASEDDTTFWVSGWNNAQTVTTFKEINTTTGAIVNSFSVADTGLSQSADWFVVTTLTIPSSPPPSGAPGGGGGSVSVPQVPCQPQTIISTPSRASGCNQGGIGSVPSYTGPSGSVPIGANPVDGAILTGQRVVFVWAQITHVLY